MSNPDRLSGLDSSFLHLEGGAAHMHVAACAVFRGDAPAYGELLAEVDRRLHLVPRYRQRLASVPLAQGRPVWVDDPHFHLGYHVRHTALPRPGGAAQLKRLAGRVFSQALDRARPLWELWLVEGLADGRFGLLSKTHHALVDGISGVDIATVLFDTAPQPAPVGGPSTPWIPRPLPTGAQLLADALLERATAPVEIARGVRAAVRSPRRLAAALGQSLSGLGALTQTGIRPAPRSPFNERIGPHRRFTWVTADLADLRQVKHRLGGTVNDVVLATVAGALGGYLRRHGHPTERVLLRAMVPVSVRSSEQHGTLGNRVAAMWVPLPVGERDPRRRLAAIAEQTAFVKQSGQALGAQALTELAGFAPPTILAQAARLQAHQRFFNLVITNVPGPQFPLYVLGRQLEAIYPMVPLAENTTVGFAVMSYNGKIAFGLTADFDALADVELLAGGLEASLLELVEAAAAPAGPRPESPPRRGRIRAVT